MKSIEKGLVYLGNILSRNEMRQIFAGASTDDCECKANYLDCTCATVCDGSYKCTNCCLC